MPHCKDLPPLATTLPLLLDTLPSRFRSLVPSLVISPVGTSYQDAWGHYMATRWHGSRNNEGFLYSIKVLISVILTRLSVNTLVRSKFRHSPRCAPFRAFCCRAPVRFKKLFEHYFCRSHKVAVSCAFHQSCVSSYLAHGPKDPREEGYNGR